jgi:YD repeat-containing protein
MKDLKKYLGQLRWLAGLLLVSVGVAQAGSVSYTYDALGRLTRAAYSNGTVIVYTYDATGNRTTQVITGAP